MASHRLYKSSDMIFSEHAVLVPIYHRSSELSAQVMKVFAIMLVSAVLFNSALSFDHEEDIIPSKSILDVCSYI